MKELKEIIQSFEEATDLGKKTALATVVKVEGSAYRREGARMLIREDGQLTGAISGGCLEGDALRRALHVMAAQRSMVVTYDTRDDDHGLGFQLGCEGVVHLLIEPLDSDSAKQPIAFFKAIFEKRQATGIATVFNFSKKKQLGTCCVFDEKGTQIDTTDTLTKAQKSQLSNYAQTVMRRGRSAFHEVKIANQSQMVFLEYIPPSPKLVIFGAGNDIRPLVEMVHLLGWESTVIDGRPGLAKQERFQQASCIRIAKANQAMDGIEVDAHTFFLLMTHNYSYDLTILEALLREEVRYIGMLGPKKKFYRMLAELEAKGQQYSESNLPQVFAPIGLDIGGSTPESIALSIVAEIQAVLSDRKGGFLRERTTPIHG